MERVLNTNIHKKVGVREAIFISLLFHVCGLFYVIEFNEDRVAEAEVKPRAIRIKFKNSSALNKPKQIVNSTESKNKERKANAKFLGKHTQSFDRQTTTATIGRFKNAGLGIRNGINKKVQEKKATQRKKKISKIKSKNIKFSDLSFNRKISKVLPNLAALGLENGNRKSRGLSKNNDFIEEVPLGDMTNLNTVETKYYGFYHRIRLKIEQYWGDTLNKKVTSMYKRGRSIASQDNHITSLKIQLDTQGNITNIHIQSTSGISELDDAAIESFSKAGPFPNPPSGMLQNGYATLEWGFVVKG